MAYFKHIAWDPRYSVHVTDIDAQHQELFSIVNRVINLHNTDSAELYPVLKNLADYASKHFHTEEMFMKEMRYPALVAHIKEHQAFTAKVLELLGRYKEEDQNLTEMMLSFLTNWICSHVTDFDQQYAVYFRQTADQ